MDAATTSGSTTSSVKPFMKSHTSQSPELDGRDDFREVGPLVVDPANKRILVCTEGGLLYAYYPQDGTMKLIRDGLFIWSDAVVLVDDVVYVHLPTQHLIHAFDVSDEGKAKPLDVRWSTMVVGGLIDDDGLPVEIDLCCYEFEALLHLGNNNFCFATWRPWEGDTTLVHFVKFSAVVHRGTGLIVCTPLTLQEHLLHSTIKALDFV